MAVIKVLKEEEFVGGTSNENIYPVTHTKAVYDSKNRNLDEVFTDFNSKTEKYEIVGKLTSPSSSLIEITGKEINAALQFSNTIKTFGDSEDKAVDMSTYYNNNIAKLVPSVTNDTITSSTCTGDNNDIIAYNVNISPVVGNHRLTFSNTINNVTKTSPINIYTNLRKYFWFSSKIPTEIVDTKASHFSNTVACNITVPADSAEGDAHIYFAIPEAMTITSILQSGNYPFYFGELTDKKLTKTLGGTSYTYKLYQSSTTLDSAKDKYLIIT